MNTASSPVIRPRPTRLPADAIAVADEATDFEIRKGIEVGTDVGRLALHLRVQGGRVLVRRGNVGDPREDEAEGVLKIFILELPDAVHEDVGRAHGGPDQAPGPTICLRSVYVLSCPL